MESAKSEEWWVVTYGGKEYKTDDKLDLLEAIRAGKTQEEVFTFNTNQGPVSIRMSGDIPVAFERRTRSTQDRKMTVL